MIHFRTDPRVFSTHNLRPEMDHKWRDPVRKWSQWQDEYMLPNHHLKHTNPFLRRLIHRRRKGVKKDVCVYCYSIPIHGPVKIPRIGCPLLYGCPLWFDCPLLCGRHLLCGCSLWCDCVVVLYVMFVLYYLVVLYGVTVLYFVVVLYCEVIHCSRRLICGCP